MHLTPGRALLASLILGLLPLRGTDAPPAAAPEPTPPPATEAPAPNPFSNEELADRLLEQSEGHYFKQEYVEAMRALDMALQFSPNEARAALENALNLQSSGDAAGALLAFQDAFRRYPKLVSIFTGLGFVRNETGDFYGALRDFTIAIDLMPVAYLAYSGRAEAKLGLDDYPGAIEDFSVQIRAAHPFSLERVYLKRGQARLALGELEAAGEDFAAALRTDPKFPAAHVFHSYTLKYTGHMPEALAALDQAVTLAPDYSRAYSARSWVHHELGHTEAALADADRCISLLPDVPEYVLNRAMLHDMLENPDLARADYARALTLAEDKANNVVWFYASFHLDLLTRRLEGKPTDAYLADAFTWPDCWQKRIGLYLAGKINAESLLKDAAQAQRLPERNNQVCEAHYFIGIMALLAGDLPTATRHLELCVATNEVQTVELGLARLHLRRLAAKAP
ncbi:lipoprotein NlpI [Lacunisphaera limnophila]|uniref:Lipoprotein NlpI n=1 Tax=Lacunisphaera limnophila TaxID=1838286 RepID=A0A1D8AXC2_9BACT|nr:tetratricopeptide repeat protein [Lacunisphaera limnophila]AOS45517.1 lipoprotein NlpI [Lacunisphaera limnophila]